MTLTTPFDAVAMAWDAGNSWYAGCGSVSLMSLAYPDPSMANGDPFDYDYPGMLAAGATLPGGTAPASTPIPVWYIIRCGIGNKLTLSCSCATLRRTTTGGSGRDPYWFPYPIANCGVASSSASTGPQATARALCATGDPPSGPVSFTGTFTDTLAYPGFGVNAGSGGTLFGKDRAAADAVVVCSPAFSRWSGLSMNWGSYNPWWDQECNLANHKRQKFDTHVNIVQTTTGTYTFAP